MTPEQAMRRACKFAGGQSALARACGVTPQAVQQWVSTGVCPAKRAMEVELATEGQVRREALRPDLYGAQRFKATA